MISFPRLRLCSLDCSGYPLSRREGFSLVELMFVIGVISLLTMISGPVMGTLQGSRTVDRMSVELSQKVEGARIYAMANNTYVRLALGRADATSGRGLPATVVLAMGAADSTLSANTGADMANSSKWIPLGKPLTMDNLCAYDALLNASNPSTADDATPSDTDIASFSKVIPGMGTVTFSSFVQFNPAGEACVVQGQTARYIKIACDQPVQPNDLATARNKNPFIIRISGVNGRVDILRKENM
jgi:prepilin-type N-terminal cleavage/methylation domain-containing protein